MTISELAYRLYQLDWDRKYKSFEEMSKAYKKYFDYTQECLLNDELLPDFYLWFTESYTSIKHSSYDSFFMNEFRDRDYMHKLLEDKFFISLYECYLNKLKEFREQHCYPAFEYEKEFCIGFYEEYYGKNKNNRNNT